MRRENMPRKRKFFDDRFIPEQLAPSAPITQNDDYIYSETVGPKDK